ncbi:MAG: L-serine ammonia-lyase [Flavobacteriaceae bacterium]|nr:L-serine ammonia-lyase [Flavobacteriaceae bacterium]
MNSISVFDMFKVGVGPSSSHTLGPWKAAQHFITHLSNEAKLSDVKSLDVSLYGSLALTGKGHATDIALCMGLESKNYKRISTDSVLSSFERIKTKKRLQLASKFKIIFDIDQNIHFDFISIPQHANTLKFEVTLNGKSSKRIAKTYYSVGGGFVEDDNGVIGGPQKEFKLKYPINSAQNLTSYCAESSKSISQIVLENECCITNEKRVYDQLDFIWDTMLTSIFEGCHSQGILPGGINVKRRAFDIHHKLIKNSKYKDVSNWIEAIRATEVKFREILQWVSCYALAVNEVNAALGRVVTAPTNGSAGVIPAVLLYYLTIENHEADINHIRKFLLVSGEIGSIFKKGATISAAMGGCQAEIGVSSAMAAAGLTEVMGGSPEQVMMAAEIAMEHHLGLTCDPIKGLVQIPCIERNSMGAIKAINAAELALASDPADSKVSLDEVIHTLWETAKDMSVKYKETSKGGLAINVAFTDC